MSRCYALCVQVAADPQDAPKLIAFFMAARSALAYSQKKLPMNNPMTSFSKYKEYHSILYILIIENNKLYAAVTTNKNRIILIEIDNIFIKPPITFYLTRFHQYALLLLFHLSFFRYEIYIFFHACNLGALRLCYLHCPNF